MASLGHPSKFQWVLRLHFIIAATSLTGGQPNLARCLPSPGLVYTVSLYTFSSALAPDGILPGAKFTLHPSLVFSYIVSVTVRHSSSGRQAKFSACYKEWKYGTFAEGATSIRQGGHHVGHRRTFWCMLFPARVQTLQSSSPSNSLPNIALYMYVYITACLCNISDKMKPKTLQVLGSSCTENRPGKYCAG